MMLPLMGPLESFLTQFEATVQSPDQVSADMLFVPVFQDQDALEDLPGLDAAAGGEVSRARASGEFRGRPYELFITGLVDGRWKAARLAIVGAGVRKACDAERLRRVAAACSYTATLRSVESVAFVVRGGEATLVPDASVRIVNGGFEEFSGQKFPGFNFHDRPGDVSFVDTAVRHGGR